MKMVSTELIINSIQERPILWDKRNKIYHNRLSSYREWEELAKELDLASDIVKKKWKNLRDTYMKEVKKKSKPRSGTDGDNEPKYTGTWPHFEIMNFLSVIVKPRKTERNIIEDSIDTTESNSMDLSETTDIIKLEEVLNENENLDGTESLNSRELPEHTFTQQQDSVSILPDISQQTRKRRDTEVEEFLDIKKEKNEMIRQDQQDNSDDDLLWFKSILPYMKQLPYLNKLRFRTQVQEMLLAELTK